MEDVGIVYGHLVHFKVFCYILWAFGIVCGHLVYFSRFGILCEDKSGNPASKHPPTILRFSLVIGCVTRVTLCCKTVPRASETGFFCLTHEVTKENIFL
jgi:hypothetical protein